MVAEHIRVQFPDWPVDEQRLAAVARYIVSAFLGTLTWWLDTDAPFSGDEIFTVCRSLAIDGAASFFTA